MKRATIALLAGLCLLMGMPFAFAAEKGISSIRVRAELNRDGSADITEIWEIEDVYEGTEYYKALNNVGENTVSNLTVSDDRGVRYTTLDTWDPDASFTEKADKCGIYPTDEGYELCWGISQMGNRTYIVSYHLAGLVKHYPDADGFYHQFISNGMSSPPKFAEVIVALVDVPLSTENSRIWAFGYQGEVHHVGGEIVAQSSEPLGRKDYVNLLVGFEPGMFDAPNGNGTFEAMQDRALHPGAYVWRTVGIVTAAIAAAVAALVLWVRRWMKHIRLADGTKQPRANEKSVELRRQPAFGSLATTHMLMKLGSAFGDIGAILSAYLIQWGLSGAAMVEEDGKKATLVLHRAPAGEKPEVALYHMFLSASDAGRLPLRQWERWCEQHQQECTEWQEALEAFGKQSLEDAGLAAEDMKGRLRLTSAGNEKYAEMLGYKKYLRQIANLETDAPISEDQWKQALVFAAYFGLASEIAPSFEKVQESNTFSDNFIYWNYNYYLFATRSGRSFSAMSGGADGSGGSSFSSGGGGFSGGGGGGSR